MIVANSLDTHTYALRIEMNHNNVIWYISMQLLM